MRASAATMTMPTTTAEKSQRKRRPLAALSVGSQHDRLAPAPALANHLQDTKVVQREKGNIEARPTAAVIQPGSEKRMNSGESGLEYGRNWFDMSNENPGRRPGQMIVDNDPPFFLRDQSSSSGDLAEDSESEQQQSIRQVMQFRPGFIHRGASGSSVDDFRSVIDDLTIENKRLKERLRNYESSSIAPLEKDKLFEVKVHGLSRWKKRQLEELLRDFVSDIVIDESGEPKTSRQLSKDGKESSIPLLPNRGRVTSSLESDARRVDSGYASMSTPGAKSIVSHHAINDISATATSAESKTNQVQSFLDDIPTGLLPRHPKFMPERVKKRHVVRRLEQLFTGKKAILRGQNSHALQQQEVSDSAALDESGAFGYRETEGVREAHILESDMELDIFQTPTLKPSLSSASEDRSTMASKSLQQRPTRPLDLDPDRAQVPSENIEYIRHLGISAPQLRAMNSTDVAMDVDGWIYLNLLINMAQLHIINVTPDFIRSAVSEASDKFQLSPDGKKIRWRGGTEGTTFSSDSVADSNASGSSDDSDSIEESNRKRRKLDNIARQQIENDHGLQPGQFTAFPATGQSRLIPHNTRRQSKFQYKPLFWHNRISDYDEMSIDGSSSPGSFLELDMYPVGKPHPKRFPRKRKDGAIVFYSGANFCTDLSADRDHISTPLYVTDIGKDGFSNHTNNALGCSRKKDPRGLSRTPSGSALPFRPFKDYSICANQLQDGTEIQSPATTELESAPDDLDFSLAWAAMESKHNASLLALEACGLGGSRPDDHFAITVETRHITIDSSVRNQLSEHSAVRSKRRKIDHGISQLSLDNSSSVEEAIVRRFAGLRTLSPAHTAIADIKEPTISAEILSTSLRHLQPSDLPPAMNYYSACSSSGDSIQTFSDSNLDTPSLLMHHHLPPSQISPDDYEPMDEDSPGDEYNDISEDGDEDSSIDMLAQAREVDPATVRALEEQFEPEAKVMSASSRATAGEETDSRVSESEMSSGNGQ